MLEKKVFIDKIEVLENGIIQVRQATVITENNTELSKAFHRHCLVPGTNLVNEDARVVVIAQAIWTPEVIAAYQASLAAMPE